MLDEFQQFANLGIIPLLLVALGVVWKKWWAMVTAVTSKYETVIAEKDQAIALLTTANVILGEKRLEEYRKMVNDYRDTAEADHRGNDELLRGLAANQQLLQQLLTGSSRRGGAA